jgi:type IV pilus assembly protein PilA
MKNFNKKNKGFTLIEILVVLGIIAILAAIVIVAVNPAENFQKATAATRSAGANSIVNTIGQFIVGTNGTIPTNIPTTLTEIGSALCNELLPDYTGVLPTDPDSYFEGKAITSCADITGTHNVGYKIMKAGTAPNQTITVCSTYDTTVCAAI